MPEITFEMSFNWRSTSAHVLANEWFTKQNNINHVYIVPGKYKFRQGSSTFLEKITLAYELGEPGYRYEFIVMDYQRPALFTSAEEMYKIYMEQLEIYKAKNNLNGRYIRQPYTKDYRVLALISNDPFANRNLPKRPVPRENLSYQGSTSLNDMHLNLTRLRKYLKNISLYIKYSHKRYAEVAEQGWFRAILNQITNENRKRLVEGNETLACALVDLGKCFIVTQNLQHNLLSQISKEKEIDQQVKEKTKLIDELLTENNRLLTLLEDLAKRTPVNIVINTEDIKYASYIIEQNASIIYGKLGESNRAEEVKKNSRRLIESHNSEYLLSGKQESHSDNNNSYYQRLPDRNIYVFDPYKELDVTPGSSEDEINRNFKLKTQMCHPDRLRGLNLSENLVESGAREFIKLKLARDKLLSRSVNNEKK